MIGPRNLLTDVPGLLVGQAEDAGAASGVTMILAETQCAAAVDVRGGAPGTRETEALDPVNLVGAIDALALSGGSVYGLDAASGATAWLGARGRGVRFLPDTPSAPIVPAAVIFDLLNGGNKAWRETPPYRALGMAALDSANADFALGNRGAGLGARAGAYKGGTGSASFVTKDGTTIGALVIVNAVGSPVIPGTDVFWAYPFEQQNEFGGRRPKSGFAGIDLDLPADIKPGMPAASNTTIAVVATDAELTRSELKRVAIMAQDGLARALRPVHAPTDGDTVFALSTAKRPLGEPRVMSVMRLGSLAADCLARAIARGVYAAETLGAIKSYRATFG